MKNFTFTLALSCFLVLLHSCNPECDSIFGLQASTQMSPSGHEILLTADPPNSLEFRRVKFNETEAKSRFVDDVGLIVEVPQGLSRSVDLRIEDLDCGDFVSINFDVVGDNFFFNNPEFVFPPIPEIIIPNLPTDFPPSIENAWLHPLNTDYCFWFKFLPDEQGDCTKFIDPVNSFEQSTCGFSDRLYAKNPLSGRIEADGSAFVSVNRPGGVEEFEGRLINPEDVPEQYRNWQDISCNGSAVSTSWPEGLKNRDFMMLLTSLNNGRQLLIYQQGVPGAPNDCL